MISFIKKHWILIALAFVAVMLLGLRVMLPAPGSKQEEGALPTPTPEKGMEVNWEGIEPGKSSVSTVKEKLGVPAREIREKETVTLEYPSHTLVFPNLVVAKDEKVEFIKERYSVSRGKNLFTKLVSEYGEPEMRFYGPRSSVGFDLYVWTKVGVAAVANGEQGQVMEVWYFVPGLSLGEFRTKWAKEYTTEEPKYRF